MLEAEARAIIESMICSRAQKDALLAQWIRNEPGARFVVHAAKRRRANASAPRLR
jgi:hypothetical protein